MRAFATLLSVAFGLALAPVQAFAETVTVTYTGTIQEAYDHPVLDEGDAVTVTYVLDTAAPDRDPDPSKGWFIDDAVVSFRVQIPAADLDVVLGPGQLQTFDNTANPDDQVSVYAGRVLQPDTLGGSPVNAAELGFTGFPGPNGEPPSMITTDALPTRRLQADVYSLFLHTVAAGWSNVKLEITSTPELTVKELVDSAISELRAAVQSGAIGAGNARSLAVKLRNIERLHGAGRNKCACKVLRAFSKQVAALSGKQMPVSLGNEMKAHAALLDAALGGCRR
ncbi:FIMAH domain-containing protein [Cognatilysobacter bugurensis]|uniref:Uncharacterized protein n=1 Tax=Cognatilysobacter bugurensis TaxID=543356 RepID=A0A918WA57_9GAMM|nr:hypothetical protein [Lysobacter bugurensis]GHA83884.1 hypothetical protein GCM10007067_22530 [Lysobacter bugurensis]